VIGLRPGTWHRVGGGGDLANHPTEVAQPHDQCDRVSSDSAAARRAHAKATFRVLPRAILADGQLERLGQLRTWQTVGVFHIAGGKIAECRLVPFDQYLFEELWS